MSEAEVKFTPPPVEEISHLIHGLTIHTFLAAGGMGAIYQATDHYLQREVAIKLLPREFSDPHYHENFHREARALAASNHHNVVGIYYFGEADGFLFLVLELVTGPTLYAHAYKRRIHPLEVATLAEKIAMGLDHIHTSGYLHRDLKPANIFLTENGEPKIGDFGLARRLDETANQEVHYGTPGYIAQELQHSPQRNNSSTDVYALGVILHGLLTGKQPTGEEFTPPSRLVGCDRRFDQVVLQATHPTPALRTKRASDLAVLLREIRRDLEKKAASPEPHQAMQAGQKTQDKESEPSAFANFMAKATDPVLWTHIGYIAIIGTLLAMFLTK